MNDKFLRRTNKFWILIWSLIFAAVAIVLAVVASSTRRTDSGEGATITEIKSITCTADDTTHYPFFTNEDATTRNLKLSLIYEAGTVRSIFLQYLLDYDTEEAATTAEAANHAAMNIAYGADGLEADAFQANYTTLGTQFKFSIYAAADKLDSAARKYFLVPEATDNNSDTFKAEYAKIGMKCIEDSRR